MLFESLVPWTLLASNQRNLSICDRHPSLSFPQKQPFSSNSTLRKTVSQTKASIASLRLGLCSCCFCSRTPIVRQSTNSGALCEAVLPVPETLFENDHLPPERDGPKPWCSLSASQASRHAFSCATLNLLPMLAMQQLSQACYPLFLLSCKTFTYEEPCLSPNPVKPPDNTASVLKLIR